MANTASGLIIVPDTNIYLSGLLTQNSPSATILDYWTQGNIELVVCEAVLYEISQVLSRPYFKKRLSWDQNKIKSFIWELSEGSFVVPAKTNVDISPDPRDNMLFACALESGAEYVVSGDKKHVLSVGKYKNIKTISPKDFVDLVDSG